MYLKQTKTNGKTFLSFVQGFRLNGVVKSRTVEKIGYLEELKDSFQDPIAHFKAIAAQRNKNTAKEELLGTIQNAKLESYTDNLKNLGYFFLKKLYNELNLKPLFKSKQTKINTSYNLESIFEFLVYSRILFPGSKKETHENKNAFFDNFDFSLKDLYRSLDYLPDLKNDIEALIWKSTKDSYKRDTSSTYYDCTNYYFEISYNDNDLIDEEGKILEKGYRKKGPSKEHRKSPIISLGLLMDKTGIPLSFDLFPGNESEKQTIRPILKRTKNKFRIERTIVVADRGLNTSDNTFFIAGKNDDDHPNHDGYVYGQSVLGADDEFKKWVLDPKGYTNDPVLDSSGKAETYRRKVTNNNGELSHYEDAPVIFTHKSRIFGKEIKITREGKRTNKVIIYQKQLAYYSKKYAEKQKYDRELVIAKAKDLIKSPGKYNKATSYGATNYINNIKFVKSTGEIPDGLDLTLNLDKIKDEEKYDGYYSIVTSEKKLTDKEIRDIYKGLWKIEESFKITKTNLETRPIYVWTPKHIEAHFLTCFVALVVLRLFEYKTNHNFNVAQIKHSLLKLGCSHSHANVYQVNYRDEIIIELEKIFKLDFSYKYMTRKKITKQ